MAGYAVAPDQKSILYTVIDINGDSALWSIDSDGSHKRRVLDCPQAECVGPVWVPGGAGGKLVY